MQAIDWKDTGLKMLPGLLLVVLVLLASRIPLPFYDAVIPVLPVLPAVYYWSLYRPAALPLWLLALVSLAHDALYGLPLGLSLFLFLAIRALSHAIRRRLSLRSFALAWLCFALMLLLLFAVFCLWLSWIHGLHPVAVFSRHNGVFFFTWLSYPPLHLFFNWCYRQLPAVSARESK